MTEFIISKKLSGIRLAGAFTHTQERNCYVCFDMTRDLINGCLALA
jgi:hypothetical protein